MPLKFIIGITSQKFTEGMSWSFANTSKGWGYDLLDGNILHDGYYFKYGVPLRWGDRLSVILDRENFTLSFEINDV